MIKERQYWKESATRLSIHLLTSRSKTALKNTWIKLRSMESSCWGLVVFILNFVMLFVREMGIVFYVAGATYCQFFGFPSHKIFM